MHADLKYVESLEKEIDELESDKAEFSDMYDVILQECVSNDVKCSYFQSLFDLDALDELQFLYLHKVKNDTVCNEKASNVFRKEREQCFKIQDLRAQLQDKNIAISKLKKLIEKGKGKSMDTKFDRPSVVRQPNAQRIPKALILGKPAPFSISLERIYFSKTKSVPKANVSEGVNYKPNVSRPQLKSNQSRDKALPNNSQVKAKKTQVEFRPRIPSVSNKMKSIVQLILFIVDSGCTKHMTGNLKLLCNFVEKFLGTVRFGNDQFAPILGYEDLVQENVTINKGNDLLTGNRGSDPYTISLQESTSSTPLCLMAKAIPTQAWLWHRRLSHLNFDYINLLSKKDIVIGLPKLKYVKDQLCSSCELSKAKRRSFKSKTVPSLKGRLNLLHMDLCGPMQVASINGKKYILTLNAFFKEDGIEHQTSTAQTPEQNGVVERRNRTLVEAARMMLSVSQLPLFFWAEAIATACYTQNRSIILLTNGITPYHIINDNKPSIKHLHIFGCICYITRDGESLDKMKEKGDPCIMVGYSTQSKGYRVYNKRTRMLVESIHIRFDEVKEVFKTSVANDTSGLVPQRQKASDYDNPDLVPQRQDVYSSADADVPSQQELDLLFRPLYDEFFNAGSNPQDKQPLTNIPSTTVPSTYTNVHAEENNNDQA
nr:hypothetical protein [Tanacetum cinerariifolium]